MPVPTWYVFKPSDADAKIAAGDNLGMIEVYKAGQRVRLEDVVAYHYDRRRHITYVTMRGGGQVSIPGNDIETLDYFLIDGGEGG